MFHHSRFLMKTLWKDKFLITDGFPRRLHAVTRYGVFLSFFMCMWACLSNISCHVDCSWEQWIKSRHPHCLEPYQSLQRQQRYHHRVLRIRVDRKVEGPKTEFRSVRLPSHRYCFHLQNRHRLSCYHCCRPTIPTSRLLKMNHPTNCPTIPALHCSVSWLSMKLPRFSVW